MDTKYNPANYEKKILNEWLDSSLSHSTVDNNKTPYSIVIPPPNVTGVLHMGHALNNTYQDILIRWEKMHNKNTCWIPGTDHAGIATQNVVEKKIKKEKNKSRHDIGRDSFLKEVWDWKKHHGNYIIDQLKKLGCFCDWERERFTMDDGLSEAVFSAFENYYNKGLIYKGDFIINWCPRCQTALSDIEVEYSEQAGKLYHIKYPVEGEENKYVTVATTRPETMLGDVAVAFHPEDKRYSHLKNKNMLLPLTEKKLKTIFDEYVDKSFGTGALKVTPAHDPNDFEMGVRHNLERILVLDESGIVNNNAPKKYRGLKREEARKVIVEDLKKLGLIEKIEKHPHSVGECYRCDTTIEPYLSKQWFVRMKPLAKKAIKAVEEGEIKFTPERWKKVYLEWMNNIRDWCISRQIWWGHRIPVYYCDNCNEEIVSSKKPDKCPKCESEKITQDEDVLDTWFSSALWPFSTLGWPDKTEELEYFYPTKTLVTAPEILFFWVARMIMSGYEFMEEKPFSNVFLTGTVRDETGKKMSKSYGNVIDPLEIIEKYGADALRFTLMVITAQGQDVFLSDDKFQIGRNFSNKIWNASRFVISNIKKLDNNFNIEKLDILDKFILQRFYDTTVNADEALKNFRFDIYAKTVYEYVWDDFCDWYIEGVKSEIYSEGNEDSNKLKLVLYLLQNILKMLHPVMPFITEEIYKHVTDDNNFLVNDDFPLIKKNVYDKQVRSFEIIKETVREIRNLKSNSGIKKSLKINVIVSDCDFSSDEINYIEFFGNCNIDFSKKKLCDNYSKIIVEGKELFCNLDEFIDLEEEKKRLEVEITKLEAEIKRSERMLGNTKFVENAPEKIVLNEKKKYEKYKNSKKKLDEAYEKIIKT
ncbi:MAG: valine--tRNA ligase [Candidatus Muiribacteriota bacterium]